MVGTIRFGPISIDVNLGITVVFLAVKLVKQKVVNIRWFMMVS